MLCPVFAAVSDWMVVGRELVASCVSFIVTLMKLSVVSLFIVIPVNAPLSSLGPNGCAVLSEKTHLPRHTVWVETLCTILVGSSKALWTFNVGEDGHHDVMDVFAPSVWAGVLEHVDPRVVVWMRCEQHAGCGGCVQRRSRVPRSGRRSGVRVGRADAVGRQVCACACGSWCGLTLLLQKSISALRELRERESREGSGSTL